MTYNLQGSGNDFGLPICKISATDLLTESLTGCKELVSVYVLHLHTRGTTLQRFREIILMRCGFFLGVFPDRETLDKARRDREAGVPTRPRRAARLLAPSRLHALLCPEGSSEVSSTHKRQWRERSATCGGYVLCSQRYQQNVS